MSHFLSNYDILPQNALHFRDLRLFVAIYALFPPICFNSISRF